MNFDDQFTILNN